MRACGVAKGRGGAGTMKAKVTRFKVGKRVKITLPGTIAEIRRGIIYVRIIVKGEHGNTTGEACCYRDEVRLIGAAK
jgi:hypothetical protein